MRKQDILPIVIAAILALGVVIVVRLLIPGGAEHGMKSQDIAMPNIPLMVKESKKSEDVEVLIAAKDIKRGEKISQDKLEWRKWPKDVMQSNFIAKTLKGQPLNNGKDRDLAMQMWAKSDIPNGTPIIISILSPEDILKKEAEEKRKAEEAKRKAEEEARAAEEERKRQELIGPGMRAVTFNIDPKSTNTAGLLRPGDKVDVLIIEQKGNAKKTYKYKGIKVIAIDGVTELAEEKAEKEKTEKKDGGFFSRAAKSINSFVSVKDVTLEIKENMVDVMLKQVGNGGIILSIKSQEDEDENEESEVDEEPEVQEDANQMKFIATATAMSRAYSENALNELREEKEEKKRKTANLLGTMSRLSANQNIFSKEKGPLQAQGEGEDGTKYEIVSGRIVGPDGEEQSAEEEEKLIFVHKGKEVTSVSVDKNGNKTIGNSGNSSSSLSMSSGRKSASGR